jgi:hypothetical protein
MKPKRTTKASPSTSIPGTWIDTDDLVKEGESKEIAEGVWVSRPTLVVLDPPEPIKKPAKRKSPKRKK